MQEQPFWTGFLEYRTLDAPAEEGTPKEMQRLSETEKALFEALREWRLQIAQEKGYPPYGVATNSHLLEIIQKRCLTAQVLFMPEEFRIGQAHGTNQ